MNDRHPTKRVQLPNGTRPGIDIMLVPLIKALWKAGYETIGSCQDTGESGGTASPAWGARWKGYALLEMRSEDACRLLDAVKDTPQFHDRMHWTDPGAWTVSVPMLAFGGWYGDDAEVSPWAQIHFPNDLIDDLIKVITAG